MSELYHALGNTDYGDTLRDNIRFGSFKPDFLENWQWAEILGQDVNNLEHMEHTAGLTAWYIFEADRLGVPFSQVDQDILMTTAYTHDFAEAIDGDVPDPLKKTDDDTKRQERNSFYLVASAVTDYPDNLTELVMDVTQGRHRLSRDFRAIEIIGYIETGKKAGEVAHRMGEIQHKYDFDLPHLRKLYLSLLHLHDAVIAKDLTKLEKDFSDLPVVRSYLDGQG